MTKHATAASIESTLAALADPTRRRIVELLSAGQLQSGAIADQLDVSPQVMSRHLRLLRQGGLIECIASGEEDARVRVYQLRQAPFQRLRGWLNDIENLWVAQLSEFRDHVEARAAGRRSK